MPFIKDETGVAQTAANVSATIVSAFVDKFDTFDDAVEAFNELRKATFADLAAVVQADNEKFAAAENGSAGNKASTPAARASKTGGSRAAGKSATRSKVTLDEAATMELKFGAFMGETLDHVLDLNAAECDADYSYGDGERDGKDYIVWLAGDRNENAYVQLRARLVLDNAGIGY